MGFIDNFFNRYKLRGPKNSIRRMFFERAEKFTSDTAKILNKMPGALEAISELIEERETFKNGGVLEWSEVSLTAANTDDALIILIGLVRFPPGAEVSLKTGEIIKVTPDTEQYFIPRLVRIGIPLKIADSGKDQVKEYLKKAQAEQEKELEDINKTLNEIIGDVEGEGATSDDISTKETKTQDTVTTGADFDLSQLTEEQRQRLILSTKMGRG